MIVNLIVITLYTVVYMLLLLLQAIVAPLEQLELLMSAAKPHNEFFTTPGMSSKQMYKVQRIVFDVEDALVKAKTRPPPVMSFSNMAQDDEPASNANNSSSSSTANGSSKRKREQPQATLPA
jgi:hypothetical protein